jgi:hypothetical protein
VTGSRSIPSGDMSDNDRDRYRAHPRVVHETLDDEVIAIQIESGLYYSMTGSGADIWELVHREHTVDEAVDALERRFDSDPDTLRSAVADLVARLRDESLLEPVDGDAPLAADTAANGAPRRPFAPPVLERFDDMQDFLLVDPIHEVDDTGWPHTKT